MTQSSISPPVFVFGSNLAGRHGKGAALFARQHHGAIYGQGVGFQGNSYAIPTKGVRLEILPIGIIYQYVRDFLDFARANPAMRFQLTPVGCGLAGYRYGQIAPLFAGYSANISIPPEFKPFLDLAT